MLKSAVALLKTDTIFTSPRVEDHVLIFSTSDFSRDYDLFCRLTVLSLARFLLQQDDGRKMLRPRNDLVSSFLRVSGG